MRALVYGLRKALIGGSATTFPGDACEAELVRPVSGEGDVWWVRFERDLDGEGNPVTRVRRVAKVLK